MIRPDESHIPSSPAPEEFDADYWELEHRRGFGTSKREPSPSLVAEIGALLPGRALDAGCGVGGDAHWLAARGWQVTALDISTTALAEGRRAAEAAGQEWAARIRWVQADLTKWEPVGPGFDVVTSHYVHVPGPQELLFQRLASWVVPGGVLLVVGHSVEHGRGHGDDPGHESRHTEFHNPPPSAQIRVQQIMTALNDDEWEVVAAEPRKHTMMRPDNCMPVTLRDVVVHARRRTPAP
jgi:SAM-dependent methyltransferase